MALMGRLIILIEDLVLFVFFLQTIRSSTFKGNYIGCLFSGDVCSEYELCSDDGLFGVCKDSTMAALEVKTIRLTRDQVSELEHNMQYLVDNGYTWHHEYTQCFVKHLVSEYIKGRNHVKYPVECARQESERKLENFGNMLERKEHNFDNSETMHYASPYGSDYDWTEKRKLDSYADDKLEQEEGEEFRQYLNKLSRKEIDNLKQFLVMESLRAPADNDSVVKKSPLSTITKVVVHYNPDGPVNDNQGVVEETNDVKYPEYSTMLEQLIPSENVVGNYEPKYEETTQEISKGQLQSGGQLQYEGQLQSGGQLQHGMIRISPTIVSSSQRPGYKHFMANQLSKTNQFGGPIFPKDGVIKEPIEQSRMSRNRQKYLVTMYVLCGFVVIATFLAVILYFVRRRSRFREKISRWANKDRQDSTGDYQDLCRHHMQSRLSEKLIDSPPSLLGRQNKAAVLPDTQSPPPLPRKDHPNTRTSSTNSSTSSWTEEPVNPNMDISTGHLILSYMEDHMKNKDRLQKEWEDICSNDGEPCSIVAGIEPMNMRKNRCTDILPYEHSRIKLNPLNNVSGSDYINANYITDHDPRNPAYIATQGPLPHTVADFWQMIWEQNSVVIVNLTRLWENSTSICHRYWPEEGTDLYHIYEVQLISEHLLCDDFVVRSLFLKNLQINETRTVTQFHFLTWPEHKVPSSTKVLLDFRRKVNKSYRGRSSPMVIHCSDGAGRTGSYCLIDMSLNRLSKGAKEIDIAATLEHLRDQRINMVRTKEQFEFALSAVAEEVHAILNFAQP